jgi:hypothetical protein
MFRLFFIIFRKGKNYFTIQTSYLFDKKYNMFYNIFFQRNLKQILD